MNHSYDYWSRREKNLLKTKYFWNRFGFLQNTQMLFSTCIFSVSWNKVRLFYSWASIEQWSGSVTLAKEKVRFVQKQIFSCTPEVRNLRLAYNNIDCTFFGKHCKHVVCDSGGVTAIYPKVSLVLPKSNHFDINLTGENYVGHCGFIVFKITILSSSYFSRTIQLWINLQAVGDPIWCTFWGITQFSLRLLLLC